MNKQYRFLAMVYVEAENEIDPAISRGHTPESMASLVESVLTMGYKSMVTTVEVKLIKLEQTELDSFSK